MHPPTHPPSLQPPHQPLHAGERISSLDTTRGLALLGIMLVNVHYFTESLGAFYSTTPRASGGWVPAWLDEAGFFVSRALCEGKFFPLYSMMFGAGMVLILEKAAAQGRRFWAVYLRRLAALAVIGLCHGFLLWFGDILFLYSLLGVGLLLLGPRCSGRTLCIVGGSLLALGVFVSFGCVGFGALSSAMSPKPVEISPELQALPPGQRLWQGMATGAIQGPGQPAWDELEREAYVQGPYLQALIVRSISYGFSVLMGVFMMGATVGGMFALGAGLMKLRFWSGPWTRVHGRMLALGLGVGVPLCCAAVIGARLTSPPVAPVLMVTSLAFGGLMTLGIAAGVVRWVQSGRVAWLARLIAVPGRMGLTNYLLTTVLMTFVSYHWGLALWGTFGSAEQVGLCLAVYAVLVAFSHAWLRFFAVGPMEWLWKSIAYLRPARLAGSALP